MTIPHAISGLSRPPLDIPDLPYDQLVRQTAERAPERPAIIAHDFVFSYREVISMTNCIANALQQLGLQKGDRLCILTTNRPEYTITFLAAATIGVAISPMNPSYKAREIAYQLEDSQACALLVQHELVPLLHYVLQQKAFPHLKHIIVTGEELPAALPGAHSFTQLLHQSSPKRPPIVAVTGDDLLALPYSSGTTGAPKGVMLCHRNLVSNHIQFVTAAGITAADVTVIFLPMYHIYGVLLTGSFLVAGATQVMMERFDLQQALHNCEHYGVSWFFAAPPIVTALANAPDLSQLKSVKHVMNAAAPLVFESARKLQARTGIHVIQAYGLTESSPDTHLSPTQPDQIRMESVGLLVHNTEQKIVDIETGEHEQPVGEDGEIIVRGPQIMLGYWNAPQETARALRNGWLYTGDIGHVDADGYTYIVDRKKEMIKYKGFSVAPAELESVLMEHPAVLDAAVIGVNDEEAGELPKGFVVMRPAHSVTADALIAFVSSKVAGYKKIHQIEFIDAIPRVPSGKILRRLLKERERG